MYHESARRIGREAWIVLFAAIALGFTWMGLSEAVINLFLVRIGFGPKFVGTAAAVANLGYALAAMPGALLCRKIGARRGMIAGSLMWVGGMMAFSLADLIPAPWLAPWIIVTRLLGSAGLALNAVSSQPYLAQVTSPLERPLAFALVISLRPLGGVFGSLLGGFLPGFLVQTGAGVGALMATLAHPRPYGITLAVGMLVYAPVIWALRALPRDVLEDDGPHTTEAAPAPISSSVWSRLAERSRGVPAGVLVAIALVCFMRVGGESTARTFFSVYADARWAVPAAQIGSAIAMASLLTIPAPLVTPALVARFGRVKMITVGALGVAASIVLMALGNSWAMASLALFALSVLAAVARSVWSLLIQESVHETWRPTSAAVANLSSGLGSMVMASTGGILAASVSYRATFLASAALVALGAVTVWVGFHRRMGE